MQSERRDVAQVPPTPMEEDVVDCNVRKETIDDDPTSHAVHDSLSDFFRNLRNIFSVKDYLPVNFQDPHVVKPQTTLVRSYVCLTPQTIRKDGFLLHERKN